MTTFEGRGFEVGTAVAFRATHVMPGMPPPEGEPHEHDYRIEIVVGRTSLDANGFVCDLDALNDGLSSLRHRLEGRDLEAIRPAESPAVTVEVFARRVHDELAARVRGAGGEWLSVRVWESETEFGGYRGPV